MLLNNLSEAADDYVCCALPITMSIRRQTQYGMASMARRN